MLVLNLPRETAVRMHEHCVTTGEWLAVYYEAKAQFICLTTTGKARVQVLYHANRNDPSFAELLPLEWLAKVADDENISRLQIRLPDCTANFVNYDIAY